VIVTAPAAFAWTHEADPERHDRAAELLGGSSLPETLRELMKDLGVPTSLSELGYTEDDIAALVEGTMAQQRLLVGAPREPSEDDLADILRASLHD
jgi:alcohol dehydrogenase class IV